MVWAVAKTEQPEHNENSQQISFIFFISAFYERAQRTHERTQMIT